MTLSAVLQAFRPFQEMLATPAVLASQLYNSAAVGDVMFTFSVTVTQADPPTGRATAGATALTPSSEASPKKPFLLQMFWSMTFGMAPTVTSIVLFPVFTRVEQSTWS